MFKRFLGNSTSSRPATHQSGQADGTELEEGAGLATDDEEEGEDREMLFGVECRERLYQRDGQLWALGLGMLMLLLVTFALREPISCVEHTSHEAMAPTRCKGLMGDPAELRLPDYCWKPCFGDHRIPMLVALALGLLFQALVVLSSENHCHNWLRLSFYWDFQHFLNRESLTDKLREVVDRVALRDIPSNFIKKRVKRVAERITGRVQAVIHDEVPPKESKTSIQQIASPESASMISQGCFAVAFTFMMLTVVTNVSMFPVSFQCDDIYVRHSVSFKPLQSTALILSPIILVVVLMLESNASWTHQVKITPKDPRAWRPYVEPDEGGQYIAASNVRAMTWVQGQRLKAVLYDDVLWSPRQAVGRFPEPDGPHEMVLHFESPSKRQEEKINRHRQFSVCCFSFATLMLFVASCSCWTCVFGVQVVEQMSVLELHQHLLLMGACGRHAGIGVACRLGFWTLLVAVLQQVIILKFSNTEEWQLLEIDDWYQELIVKLIDFRDKNEETEGHVKSHVWVQGPTDPDPASPSAGAMGPHPSMQAAGETRTTPPVEELAMDFRKVIGAPRTSLRRSNATIASLPPIHLSPEEEENIAISTTKTWVRSQLPRDVEIVRSEDAGDSEEKRRRWANALVRENQQIPRLMIKFKKYHRDDARSERSENPEIEQIVPPEFVSGHGHAYLNLGPKIAWEQLSACLGFCAFGMAMFDVISYFGSTQGDILSTCSDVLNSDRCLYFTEKSSWHAGIFSSQGPLRFRRSIGSWAAVTGGFFAFIGVVGLRVAYESDKGRTSGTIETREVRSCECCQLYVKALIFGLETCWWTASGPLRSITRQIRANVRRTCARCYSPHQEDGCCYELLGTETPRTVQPDQGRTSSRPLDT